VSWGVGISLLNEVLPQDADQRGLQVRLSPTTGWPAIDVETGLDGLAPGTTLIYEVWAPRGVKPTVTPYAMDQAWHEHFASPTTLQPGWNTVEWRLPDMNGVNAIGLQFNNADGWGGRLYLCEVSW
jgi:hypothetical protein